VVAGDGCCGAGAGSEKRVGDFGDASDGSVVAEAERGDAAFVFEVGVLEDGEA
jgi:hypothetical protein